MKTSRRSKLVQTGVVAVLTVAVVTGCTTAKPPAPAPTSTKSAEALLMPQRAIKVPLKQKGELARLTIGLGDTLTGTTVSVPAWKHGYDVEFYCLASNPKQRAGYEIDHAGSSHEMMSASTARCDGTPYSNTDASMTAGYKLIDFHLTGDLTGAEMYAILTPDVNGSPPSN